MGLTWPFTNGGWSQLTRITLNDESSNVLTRALNEGKDLRGYQRKIDEDDGGMGVRIDWDGAMKSAASAMNKEELKHVDIDIAAFAREQAVKTGDVAAENETYKNVEMNAGAHIKMENEKRKKLIETGADSNNAEFDPEKLDHDGIDFNNKQNAIIGRTKLALPLSAGFNPSAFMIPTADNAGDDAMQEFNQEHVHRRNLV